LLKQSGVVALHAGRLHLVPLDPAAARELAADILGAGLDAGAMDLVAQAEGNPFYIGLLLRGSGGTAGG
jgi:hypothetical protein